MTETTTRFYFDTPAQQADLGATRMTYRRFGGGPALLLVHGFPLSGFTWRKLLPELSKRYTCYVPDLAGMGETQWTDATDFSFPGHAQTLKALADHLGLKRYSVLSQDTGGTFARYLALADAARVEKLSIINTEVPHHRPPWIPLYQLLMRLPGTLATFKLLLQSRWFIRSGMGFSGCFTDLSLLDGDFHEQVIAGLLRSPRRMEGMRQYLIGLKWAPLDALEQGHGRITMPVQLIWGTDDPTFPVEYARKMVKQFPDARLVEIPGAKLLVHEEKPQDVARAVLTFL
jgi:pimeloyl-ACP methyl ester carboxylesterase